MHYEVKQQVPWIEKHTFHAQPHIADGESAIIVHIAITRPPSHAPPVKLRPRGVCHAYQHPHHQQSKPPSPPSLHTTHRLSLTHAPSSTCIGNNPVSMSPPPH